MKTTFSSSSAPIRALGIPNWMLLALAVGFTITIGQSLAAEPEQPVQVPAATGQLRVGVAPEFQPLVFRQPDGQTNGLEIDFANALSAELGRPLQLVGLPPDELINALLEKRIDIIMSGVTITRARQIRVRFCDPYLHSQLRAIFPVKSANLFKTPEDVLNTTARIGVLPGSSGEVFVKQNCPNAKIQAVSYRKDAAALLLTGARMDLYVDNTYALAEMLAKNETELAFLPQPLAEEDLAWAVRPGETGFLNSVNDVMAKWKKDGTLEKLLDRWVPYHKNPALQKPASQPPAK